MVQFSTLKNRLFLFCITILIISQGCSGNKFLKEGESFLFENEIRIKSRDNIKNKGELKEDMGTLYVQEETDVVIGIPRHFFYYKTRDNPDSSWFKSWVARTFADEPVIYDGETAKETTDRMESYLRQRGYMKPDIWFRTIEDNKKTTVIYVADPGKRWHIDTTVFVSDDQRIQQHLERSAGESYLKNGDPVDIKLYQREKTRITRLLQNKGYADFSQNYIAPLIADSSGYTMHLTLEVLAPANTLRHEIYYIGDIRVITGDSEGEQPTDTLISGIAFQVPDDDFYIKPDIIMKNIYLKEGVLYTRTAFDKTYQQLSRIAAYKFVSINGTARETPDSNVIDYEILLTRNKKMGVGGELELNYSTVSFTQRSLMGVSAQLSYNNRNLMRGAEVFNTSVETGIEINLRNPDTLVNSLNLNFQNSLTIPKFIDPVGFYGFLGGMNSTNAGRFRSRFGQQLKESTSQISGGYSFVRLIRFYDYHSLNLKFGYEIQPDIRTRIRLTHAGIDYFSPDFKPAFQSILDRNVFLRESFNKQLFTGLLFKDYTFEYSSPTRRSGFSYRMFYTAEISGLEIFAVNSLYNAVRDESNVFRIGGSNPLDFSHFIKFDFDNRWYQSLGSGQQLAFRLGTGIGFTYGPFSQQVPYIKQFYLGGPVSIRAWQIRELGPGGYHDTTIPSNSSLPFYQTGDFKLEASIEYRADLFWIFESAIFIDAGNVWTVRHDPSRPGAQISWNFLDQIAIGTGFGLRMDFSYFIIRLDFGYKIRSPFPVEGDYWLFENIKNFSLSQFTTNFAIGYPF